MSDDFGEFHEELRTVARNLLGKSGAAAAVEWSVPVRAGWTGLEIADEFEGAAATFTETAVLLEEIGRAAARTPYPAVATAGIGALKLLAPGTRRDVVLRETVAGTTRPVAVLAGDTVPAAGGESACSGTGGIVPAFRVTETSTECRLSGSAEFVLDAVAATVLLLPVQGVGGRSAMAVLDPGTPGLRIAEQPVVDESRSLARVSASDVVVPRQALLAFRPDIEDPLRAVYDRAALAVAWDSVGIGAAMLDATVDYVGVREQFGRVVGSFQAVKHACADMLVELTVARRLVAAATAAPGAGAPPEGRAVSMAKSYAADAAVRIAGKAMQLHGGIGYTWESGIHRYLKRATMNRALFGSAAEHRRALAEHYR